MKLKKMLKTKLVTIDLNCLIVYLVYIFVSLFSLFLLVSFILFYFCKFVIVSCGIF
jgi:hypothetical protein